MPGPGKGIASSNVILENSIFSNNKGVFIEVIDAGGIFNVKILSSNIYQNKIGIHLENRGWMIDNTTILNCTIKDNEIGVYMDQIYDTSYVINNSFIDS